jgi:pilus assembly protein Flp/PilA
MQIRQFITKFVRDERGVTALEYAILAAVALGGSYLSSALKTGFGSLSSSIVSATA